jgi:hypothetical protein
VAKILIRYPRTDAGYVHAFVHWEGQMLGRGIAGDGGKAYPAIQRAAELLAGPITAADRAETPRKTYTARYRQFLLALFEAEGGQWENALRAHHFRPWQVI